MTITFNPNCWPHAIALDVEREYLQTHVSSREMTGVIDLSESLIGVLMCAMLIGLAMPIFSERISNPERRKFIRRVAWILFVVGLIAFALFSHFIASNDVGPTE